MDYSVILDLFLSVLLVVTIGYAMVLNRKISGLRRDRASLEKLLTTFSTATAKAGSSLSALHKTADDLQAKINIATTLRDDLAFLADRGVSVADRLEDAVRISRDPVLARKGTVQSHNSGSTETLSRGAARGSRAAGVVDGPATKSATIRDFTPAQKTPAKSVGIHSLAGAEHRGAPVRRLTRDSEPMEMEPRSEAERDLLRALRAAR